KLLLVDREFFTAGIISVIKQKHLKFLMPAKKTPRIKDAILQYVNRDRKSISNCMIQSASGHVESFTLVILPNKNARKKSNLTDQYITFATNISPKEISHNIQSIPTDYKQRWGIETGYACIGRFRPKTIVQTNP
ncbi:MAG: transposase, partial [Nitrosopumilus sp.]|nr:transposase [Nitrosopumilus sp.]MBA4718325.1 transposase [Nitrosopumilus sp.]MBA4719348.1 transposase [Nitrosopumilus sp.]